MRFANATNINRKSGGAKPRDLQFRGPLLEMFFDGAKQANIEGQTENNYTLYIA